MARPLHALTWALLCLLLCCVVVPPANVAAQQTDARLFPQTGYRVGDDAVLVVLHEAWRRADVRLPGLQPVHAPRASRSRSSSEPCLQLRPDGAVAMMNVLDDGMLPYTTINGSTFPASDPEVIKRQPKVGEPDYHEKALQFVQGQRPRHLAGAERQLLRDVQQGRCAPRRRSRTAAADAGLLLGLQPGSLGPADLEADGRPEQCRLRLPAVPARHHALRRRLSRARRACCWPTT